MKKTVVCQSGLKGWRDRLHKVYSSYEEFVAYCDVYNIHNRCGFATPEAAWAADPLVQGSTNPDDLQRVRERRPHA